jgi:copper(I)-binding protein
VVSALALAGCGAGQITQTSSQVSGVGGASANVGQIAIREAAFPFTGNGKSAVIYPQGGSAPLTMSVVNFGGQDDKLTGASSPAAASVTISGDATIASGRLLFVNGQPGAEQGSAGATATAAPGSASAGSAPRSAQATPAPGSALATPAPRGVTTVPAPASAQITARPGDVTGPPVPSGVQATPAPVSGANAQAAPPTGPLAAGTTTAQVVLTGLKQNLAVGPTYPVVLTFQRAGAVTVQVPVANPSENQGPTGE